MSVSDALGAASAAVQFASFLSDFIGKVNQVRKKGITIDEQCLRDKTINLITTNTKFLARNDAKITGLESTVDVEVEFYRQAADRSIAQLTQLSRSESYPNYSTLEHSLMHRTSPWVGSIVAKS